MNEMSPTFRAWMTRALRLLMGTAVILSTCFCGAGRSGIAHAETAGRRSRVPVAELRRLEHSEHDRLAKLYLHLHRNPELSKQEHNTAARMAREMRDAGFEVTTKIGGLGVVGILRNGDGPVVMIRGDMDGLPIIENTGAPYASKVRVSPSEGGAEVGVMHACGHDMHMTVLVGAGRLLSSLRRRWSGTVVLVAQPAEEAGGGAQSMVDDGLYERFPRPDFALSVHTDAGLLAGRIGTVPGPYNANITGIDITVRGVGGHGAYPHKTRDPIVVASQLVLSLQTVVSREVNPIDPAVVTVGSIHGGTKANIIPEEVTLLLTVRTHREEVRRAVVASIERIARGVGRAAGLPDNRLPEVTIRGTLPSVLNDREIVERANLAMRAVLSEEDVVHRPATMGGDDFAIYGAQEPRIPCFMFRLGTVSAEAMERSEMSDEPLPGLHSPRFLPDYSPAIRAGVLGMSTTALELLHALR